MNYFLVLKWIATTIVRGAATLAGLVGIVWFIGWIFKFQLVCYIGIGLAVLFFLLLVGVYAKLFFEAITEDTTYTESSHREMIEGDI